jgi:hypothetical protein
LKVIKLFPNKQDQLREVEKSIKQIDRMIIEHLNQSQANQKEESICLQKLNNENLNVNKLPQRVIDIGQKSLSWISNVLSL